MADTGVLLMAYGTPEHEEQLEAYYTDIRRGRPPTPELLADLRRRYDAIGGLSPLAERTRAQAAALQAALDDAAPGRFAVRLGLKHAAPFVEDGAAALAGEQVGDVVGLVLAPHTSALSTGQYHERARAAVEAAGARYHEVGAWYTEPRLAELLAERVGACLGRFPDPGRVVVLVTAHSLPERALAVDDPAYPEQLRRTGAAIAERLSLPESRWHTAWQSAGRTPEPWFGPDILDVLRALGDDDAVDGVVVCPAGFTADHLEVLFDVDIEARGVAHAAGLRLERTASLNDDPAFVALLADLVLGTAP